MELEIIRRVENPLLEREEIRFRLTHAKAASPKRKLVREQIAEALDCKPSLVVIDNMAADFGRPETVGYAKHYRKKETMQAIEAPHILKRNGLFEAAKQDKAEEA